MALEPTLTNAEEQGGSTVHLVHALAQFLGAVRYRRSVVLGALAAALLLGGLYYATATRYYGAAAELLVMQSGLDKLSTSISEGGSQQGQMLTFENLLRSAKVLEEALKKLPPEHRVDLAGVPESRWVAAIQKNLSAKAIRQTNLIQVSYRSKDPHAAVAVVNAVVQAYIAFIDATHRGNAGEIIRVLAKEQTDLADKLARKEQELLDARRQFGDLGIRSGSKVVHPLVQRAVSLNEELIGAQKQRVTVEASLAAIQAAVRNGEDLRQHVVSVADAVGREMLMTSLGFSSRDASTQAYLERELLETRASVKMLEEYLGPAHPELLAKGEKIRAAEQYLLQSQQRVNEHLARLQATHLGPMLIQMVQQKLNEMLTLESSLQARFDQACAAAVDLNGQVSRIEILEHDLQWLRNLHDVLLNQIANVDLKQDSHEIRTAIVHDPKAVESPISPNLYRTLAAALALGLALGLASVYVLDVLDDRFRGVEEMQSRLGVPVLAMIRQMPSEEAVGVEGLHVHPRPNSNESEAFRTLRTALALAQTESRQLAVTSAEPGDGKTTVLANLGVCLAQAGKRTLLVDADLRRPGLTNLLGMRGLDGLSGVIRGEGDVVAAARAAIRPLSIEGLDALPSGLRPANPAELLVSTRLAEFLAWAETVYDQILIDTPPVLATSDAALVGRQVDGVVLVVQADKNRRRGLLRVTEHLGLLKIPLLGLVVNRVGSDRDRGYYGYGYGSGYGYGYGYGYQAEEGRAEEPQDAPFEEPETRSRRRRRASVEALREVRIGPRRVA